MKNIFLLMFVGFPFAFYGQNNLEHSQDSLLTKIEKYNLQGKEYCITEQVEEEFMQKTFHFPKEFSSIEKDISLISQVDTLFASYVQVDEGKGSAMKLYYLQDSRVKGIFPNIDTVNDNLANYLLYDAGIPIKKYSIKPFYDIHSWIEEMVFQDFNRPMQEQPLEIDSIKQSYKIQDQFASHGQRVITPCYSVVEQKIRDKDTSQMEYVFLRSTTAKVDNWIVIAKKSGVIWVYDIVSDAKDNGLISLQKARINNIGFDQKRVVVFQEDKQLLWGAYFEPTRNSKWNKTNQFEFDYNRKSDKKAITARVVVDYGQELNTPFFKIVLALTHNPEYFKITTSLNDLDFSQICKTFDFSMKSDFKNTYTLKDNL
ncbi:hypothetical protein ACYSNX_12275 [Myroides sp. LJL115]